MPKEKKAGFEQGLRRYVKAHLTPEHVRIGGAETAKVTFCDAAKKEILKIVADAIRKAK